MKSIRWFISIVLTILPILGACMKVGPATPETTPVPATKTPIIPTATISPTLMPATSTPTPAPVSVEIPECVPDGSGGELWFHEALQATSERMSEWDSYRFRTLYEFLDNNDYAPEDLSVQVQGEYLGLHPIPEDDLFQYPMASQRYSYSRVMYTDLRTRKQSETVITPDGYWYLPPGESGWIAFKGAKRTELLQLAEMFSPEEIISPLSSEANFGGPSVQADRMAFEKPETIEGKAVIHRCWVIPNLDELGDAYINLNVFVLTLLKNVTVHLWTADNGTELVRLILTGTHTGEYYHEQDFDLHDTTSQFILWLDIDKIDQAIEINQPAEGIIVATLPGSTSSQNEISNYSFNNFPIPKDVSQDSTDVSLSVPLEFLDEKYNMESNVMSLYVGPAWDLITTDREVHYNTKLPITHLTNFYFDEMTQRGWLLAAKFLEAGLPRLFLFFQREQIVFPIILTPLPSGITLIEAFLPPTDEVLEVVRNNWVFFDEADDPLLAENINAIAFDSQGQAWIGTGGGVVRYDGTTWTDFTAKELELEWPSITAVAVDQRDNIWVGCSEGIKRYDGTSWSSFTTDSLGESLGAVKSIGTTQSDEIWVGFFDGKMGVFDGIRWNIYSRGKDGPETSHIVNSIAFDPNGNIWIGTDGGGIFAYEGNEWRTIAKDINPPNSSSFYYTVNRIAFDQQGWLWVAMGGSMRIFDGLVWHDYDNQALNIPFSYIDQFFVDQYNRIWMASYYYSLIMQDDIGQWTSYSPLDTPKNASFVTAMTIDSLGRIWIGTDHGLGIFTIPPGESNTVRYPLPTPQPTTPTQSLPETKPGWTSYAITGTPLGSRIGSISVDQQNRIWLAGWGAVVIDNNGKWLQYTLDNTPDSGLLSDSVNDIVIDKLGRIWMATDNGLSILDESAGWSNYIPETSELPYRHVLDIEIDSQDHIWSWSEGNISDERSISMIRTNGQWLNYTKDTLTYLNEKPLSSFVTAIEADHQGRIWFSTYDGITVLSTEGSLNTITYTKLGLPDQVDSHATTLFADNKDRLWIGTEIDGLLSLSEDRTIVRYSLSEMGLDYGQISTIMVDNVGRVWVGSDVGLSVLNTDSTWINFTPNNSELPSAEITSLAIDNLGRVWIGTVEGLAVYVWPSK